MVHPIFMTVLLIPTVMVSISDAAPGIPNPDLCVVSRAYSGPESVVIFNTPNAGGSPFNTCGIIFEDGSVGTVDATIELVVNDGSGSPLDDYPREDIWLESSDGGLVACAGGTIADYSTNGLGYTSWDNPLHAGGWSEGNSVVWINGQALTNSPLDIRHNSPDINGDLVVDLSDFVLFATDYFGGYNFRSDFCYDGIVNLLDVPKFAQAYGAACP